MAVQNPILVLNPGSASRKYAYYQDGVEILTLHFEYEPADQGYVCTVEQNGEKNVKPVAIEQIDEAIGQVPSILAEHGVLIDQNAAERGVQAAGDLILAIRVPAPTDYFAENHLVDDEYVTKLHEVAEMAPLHVPVVLAEIEATRQIFHGSRLLAISDSRFHRTQPETQQYYPISRQLANEHGIKRYGYHGISISAAVRQLQNHQALAAKTVICHLGSGASVTAVLDGKSMGNSMGVTPLDGIMMATRVGSMDPSAVLILQRALDLKSLEYEKYLNKEGGLRGVAGADDMRDVERLAREGNDEAQFALELYAQKVIEAVARAAAILGGIDALVFTATIGERAVKMREMILRGLAFLGFELDEAKNALGLDGALVRDLAAAGSKAIYVVKTNEATEIALQASLM